MQFPLDLIYSMERQRQGLIRVARFRGTELLQVSQTFGYALYISDIAGHFGYGYIVPLVDWSRMACHLFSCPEVGR